MGGISGINAIGERLIRDQGGREEIMQRAEAPSEADRDAQALDFIERVEKQRGQTFGVVPAVSTQVPTPPVEPQTAAPAQTSSALSSRGRARKTNRSGLGSSSSGSSLLGS